MKPFEKTKLGTMDLNNRIGIPAICTDLAGKDGIANLHHLSHYETLAKGRPGFLIQEATAVVNEGYINDHSLGIFTPRQREPLKDIVGMVHAYEVKFGIQLNHAGSKNNSGTSKVGPMALEDVLELRQEDLQRIVVNFEFAGKWAKELGYDFVEINAAQGYLLQQFLSPLTNQRNDLYGEDRTLLLKEIITGVKSTFEKDVIVQISIEEYEKKGIQSNDMEDILNAIQTCGAVAISISHDDSQKSTSDSKPMLSTAKRMRQSISLPIMEAGYYSKETEIEQLLAEADCDFVLLGRKLIGDPYFLLKWQDRLGQLDEQTIGECLYRSIHFV